MRAAAPQRGSRGFTLVELMLTVSVIGLLSAAGTASYDSVRRQGRDVKRANDAKQIQVALEIFFETHGYYPFDGRGGIDPIILAGDDLSLPYSLSDAGFSTQPSGRIYMLNVPRNPLPGGTPYAYRSIQRDGRDCDVGDCEAYAILFTTEGSIGSLGAGPHAITPEGTAGDGIQLTGATTETGAIIGLEFAQGVVEDAVRRTGRSVRTVIDNPVVETVAETAVAPVATVAVAVNAGAAANAIAPGLQVILSLLTQPFQFLSRKKRARWGMVRNSLSRLPVDLAIVRLIDDATGNIIRSAVTDQQGRFAFLVSKQGRYRLDVIKKGIVFPSRIVKAADRGVDGVEEYLGVPFEVGTEGAFVHPDIPVDPEEVDPTDAELIRSARTQKNVRAVAFAGPAFGGGSLLVSPSIALVLLFAAQVVAYLLFRRLAVPPAPKTWGVVYDEATRKPVRGVVLRMFDATYHKLLETQVTDDRGRYSFRVGNGVYYLTATKDGYGKTESDQFDLSGRDGATVIASDLPLRPFAGNGA